MLFYFLVIFVLATLRGIDIHPINYLFIAGAFFAFHLLFAYSADHLAVEGAFALSAVVSMVLVVSYLRLVVSARFAFVEAALAQLVYLVGFSLAHFQEGFTGLTVTVLSILTLALLMQWTGRVKWSEVLSSAARQEMDSLAKAAGGAPQAAT
ncbi:MAG: inner membrane CreD family protein [Alphaproteobacteria bacterium]|nr:inner membrane CreD family protein [Alphaproteobacteria bacterium]